MAELERQTLTTSEAAQLLGVSIASLRRWGANGEGPPMWKTPGGQRRYERTVLLEWVAQRTERTQ